MSRRATILACGLALAITLATGLLLSGWLVTRFLGIAPSTKPTVYLDYVRALDRPEVRPHARRIRMAGAAGFGLPLLCFASLLVLLMRQPRRALHGDARFARPGDVARLGLFDDTSDGLVLGRFAGRLLRLAGQRSAILAAPTRSGKGVGVVIPNLLEYGGSVVVLDIKQENFDLTSGWRAAQGQSVYLFNPFAEDRRTHRWNPLSYVATDPAFRVSDLQAIAAMLYPEAGDEQRFWTGQARNAFLALALYLFERREHDLRTGFAVPPMPTLGAIHRLSCGDGADLRTFLQGLARQHFVSPEARMAFSAWTSQADETFASILGSVKEPLNAWVNPILDAATSADDFRLDEVRRRRMTIYVGIQPNRLAEARLILNLFFSQLIHVNTRALPATDRALRYPCLLLMDEFTAIGRVDIIASAAAYMAGYNLRLLPIIQSMAQLDATYGKDVARTLVTNLAAQVLYAPREQRDANDYSEMLGYTTVRRQKVTRGREVSRSESEERRALMLPQELKALGNTREVVLVEGLEHPILCEKIRYYEDRRYTARLLPRVDIMPLVVASPSHVDAPEPVPIT